VVVVLPMLPMLPMLVVLVEEVLMEEDMAAVAMGACMSAEAGRMSARSHSWCEHVY
jgi:hypothetical protein